MSLMVRILSYDDNLIGTVVYYSSITTGNFSLHMSKIMQDNKKENSVITLE